MSNKPTSTELGPYEFIALIAMITALGALSIDAMLPALPLMAQDLNVTDFRQTQWVISAIILGMAVGQLFFGPLSDALGRKPAILWGIGLFCIGLVVAMLADSLAMLLVGRVLQGIGVSGPRIASMALVRDKFVGDDMARVMSFVMMVFILMPMLAPLMGLGISITLGWRAIFGFLMLLSLSTGAWLWLRQPETLAVENRQPMKLGQLWRTTKAILKHPRVVGFSVTSGLVFGGLLAYVSTAQSIFQDIYGVGDTFVFYFAILALGFGMSSLLNGKIVMRFGAGRITWVMMIALAVVAFLASTVAFLYSGHPPLLLFMSLVFGLFFCMGILFGNLNALAMAPLGQMAGIGAAVVGSLSNVVAVILALSTGWFYTDGVTPLMLGILVAALLSIALLRLLNKLPNTDVKKVI